MTKRVTFVAIILVAVATWGLPSVAQAQESGEPTATLLQLVPGVTADADSDDGPIAVAQGLGFGDVADLSALEGVALSNFAISFSDPALSIEALPTFTIPSGVNATLAVHVDGLGFPRISPFL